MYGDEGRPRGWPDGGAGYQGQAQRPHGDEILDSSTVAAEADDGIYASWYERRYATLQVLRVLCGVCSLWVAYWLVQVLVALRQEVITSYAPQGAEPAALSGQLQVWDWAVPACLTFLMLHALTLAVTAGRSGFSIFWRGLLVVVTVMAIPGYHLLQLINAI